MLDTYLKWFESHERLIIILMVLVAGSFGLSKWLDKSAMDAASKAAVAQQVAAVQHDADQKIAAAIAQQTSLFNQMQQAHEQEMASLVAAVASRDAASTTKIKTVLEPKSITDVLADLAHAYTHINFDPTAITQDGKLAFALPVVQQFTATKIEDETAKADLTDTKKELDSTVTSLGSCTTLVGSLQTQVTGLQKEIVLDKDEYEKNTKSLRVEARKKQWGWFRVGFGLGYISGVITGHAF
jgi:hypothetical protein